MFILFTSEESKSTEKEQLISLFENGLPLLHVRKPGMNEENLRWWLSQFQEKYLRKMVLHQHYDLAEVIPVKGISLKESFRQKQNDLNELIKKFQARGLTVSSSFHEQVNLENEASALDYIFLSPVFTSVSKAGYKGRAFNVKSLSCKAIALGGVQTDKIVWAKRLGYSGVAVLGAVWLADNRNHAYQKIIDEYRIVFG